MKIFSGCFSCKCTLHHINFHLHVLLLLVHGPLDDRLDPVVLVDVRRLQALPVLLPRPDGVDLALFNK